jgi:hypothetical protein
VRRLWRDRKNDLASLRGVAIWTSRRFGLCRATPAPATSGSVKPGMERRHAPHASLQEQLEARRTTLEKRREAQRTARTRHEARRSNSLYLKANEPTKQK